MKIKPIDPSLKPLIEKFLASSDFQENFAYEAKQLGYTGDDPDKIKVALFTPGDDDQICFANDRIYQLFIAFQILDQLYTLGIATPDMDDETKTNLIFECQAMLDEIHSESK